VSPAAAARVRLSWIVLRATPSIHPIMRALMPSRAKRNICRICLMVSSLFAGIRCSSWMITRPLMPELLTRRKTPNAVSGMAGD
jgi:hypothetical protein